MLSIGKGHAQFKGSDDLPPEPLPSDAPVNPDQAEGETVAKEEEVGDVKTEAPLVDVSEQKQEEDKVEAPAAPEKNEETPAAIETEKKESDVAPASETPLVTV
ncbi:hypothetical protein OIU78_029205 [Salix suchowensis]|nr:hypothetical protein OIU78_029205 [Salix suchowensis]